MPGLPQPTREPKELWASPSSKVLWDWQWGSPSSKQGSCLPGLLQLSVQIFQLKAVFQGIAHWRMASPGPAGKTKACNPMQSEWGV